MHILNTMMRFRQLFEAPIEAIHTYGDMSNPQSLRGSDIRLVSSETGQEKIKRVLFNIPVPVVLHFVNIPVNMKGKNLVKHLKQNPVIFTPEEFTKKYGKYRIKLNVYPNAVNVVYLENEGGNRLPLTPWIIAHRMMHMFIYARKSLPDSMHRFANIYREYMEILFELLEITYDRNHFICLEIIYNILPTKAARKRNLNSAGEMWIELFALYCVTGKVYFNSLTIEQFMTIMKNSVRFPNYLSNEQKQEYQEKLDTFNIEMKNLAEELSTIYLDLLQENIGRILVL
jgi:hypothetical protein